MQHAFRLRFPQDSGGRIPAAGNGGPFRLMTSRSDDGAAEGRDNRDEARRRAGGENGDIPKNPWEIGTHNLCGAVFAPRPRMVWKEFLPSLPTGGRQHAIAATDAARFIAGRGRFGRDAFLIRPPLSCGNRRRSRTGGVRRAEKFRPPQNSPRTRGVRPVPEHRGSILKKGVWLYIPG